MSTPDWITNRNGDLALAPDRKTWLLRLNGSPMYKLTPVPAGGRFGCAITKAVNGKRLDGGTVYPTPDEALAGGLTQLQKILGW